MTLSLSKQTFHIERAGNVIQVSNGNWFAEKFGAFFTYSHKTYFQGAELYARKNLKRMNPSAIGKPEFEVEARAQYMVQDDKFVCAAGFFSRIVACIKKVGFDYKFKDFRKNKLSPANFANLTSKMPNLEFRHRQDEVLALIDASDGGIIEAPTGYGKTFIASMLCCLYPTDCLAFISPGLDLIRSTYTRLQQVVPGQVGRISGSHNEVDSRVLLCSADSMHKLPFDKVKLIIFDEVHTAATSARTVDLVSNYTDAKHIGFTASLNSRSDGADAVLEGIFGPVLTRISYAEAAEHGIVANINTAMVDVPPSVVAPIIPDNAADVVRKRLAYWNNPYRNAIIASAVRRIPHVLNNSDPQILVMVESVEHMFRLRQLLPEFEVVYASISDKVLDRLRYEGVVDQLEEMTVQRRQWLLGQFQTGQLKRVIANHCWKQGIDPIHLNAFVRADGGTSEINNIQLPGRLSRVTADKKEGLLIDFNDQFNKWAARRAQKRLSAYKKLGYRVIHESL